MYDQYFMESLMEDKERTEKWINAAIALGNDPMTEVLCPQCGEENLKTEDIIIQGSEKF